MSSQRDAAAAGGWSRAAAIAIPATLIAAASALYLQYTKEKAQATGIKKTKKGKKVASAAGSSSSSSTASSASSRPASKSSAAASLTSSTGDFASDNELVAALHADVEVRATGATPNPKLEQRIWRAIRKIDPHKLSSLAHTARTEIGQWIVAYHANTSPLMDGGGTSPYGGPAGTGSTKYLRVALDYDLAWSLLESVEVELGLIPAATRTDEQEELRKATELVLLDLAHKMRRPERMLDLYARVRARNTAVDESGAQDPQQFTEMEFFTLWMLSPLLGQWSDFKSWSDFMINKGQSLDEFHHLAVQRPDLIDFRQMQRMVDQAALEGRVTTIKKAEEEAKKKEKETKKEEEEEPAKEAEAEAQETKETKEEVAEAPAETPAEESAEPKAVEPTEAATESTPAVTAEATTDATAESATESTPSATAEPAPVAAEATSESTSDAAAAAASSSDSSAPAAVPVPAAVVAVAPTSSLEWITPSASDLEWGLWDIVGTMWKFVSSAGNDEKEIAKYVAARAPEGVWKSIAPGLVGFRKIGACARMQSMVSMSVPICGPLLRQSRDGIPPEALAAQTDFTGQTFHATGSVIFRTEPQLGQPKRLLKIIEEYKDFQLLTDLEAVRAIRAYRPSEVERQKKIKEAEEQKVAIEAAAAEAAAKAAAAAEEGADADAASAAAPAPALPPIVIPASDPISVDEFDPSDPPQLWRGIYVFEQIPVEEQVEYSNGKMIGTRFVPSKKPSMRIEYEILLKMTRSKVQASAFK